MDMAIQSKMNKILSYQDFMKDKVVLNNCKVADLKNIARKYKLHVSGKKQVLYDRITNHFYKLKNVIILQSFFRSHIIQLMNNLKGPALYNRKMCTNETDFYTLEPLHDIDYYDFFSYKDDSGFIYGFDINSLIIMLKKKSIVRNPYNRSIINFDVKKNISILSKLNNRVFNITYEPFAKERTMRDITIDRMHSVRLKPLEERIDILFYEIDLLGNYTSTSWLYDLSIQDCGKFLKNLLEIWNFRSNMPTITKNRICPYFNPFIDGLNNRENMRRTGNQEVDLTNIKTTCVTVIENIIYTGINDEYKQLGALLVLSSLTLVSEDARVNLPWLYESLEYI